MSAQTKAEQGTKNRAAVKKELTATKLKSAEDIAAKTKLKKSTATTHLKALVAEGVAVGEKVGREVKYKLAPVPA